MKGFGLPQMMNGIILSPNQTAQALNIWSIGSDTWGLTRDLGEDGYWSLFMQTH
jgi:hypothetical protein